MTNEDNTTLGSNRSSEERVFARFDAIDARLNSMDSRLEKLEAKQYDTKPVWERALAQIADLHREMNERFDDLERKFDVLGRDMYQLCADQARINSRVDRLESPA